MATTKITIDITAVTRPQLADGEHYAGILLGHDGEPDQHIILLPGDEGALTWKQARDWAESIHGRLPTRREQHLLIANLKNEFQRDWYWSSEEHASDSGYAWYQGFNGGSQHCTSKDDKLRARAVRSLIIQ
jgi:hypothetical protein